MTRAAWGSLALLGLGACTSVAQLEGRIHSVETLIASAKERGAEACAPLELAAAVAHVAFARGELLEGDADRAVDHIVLAEPNARAAMTLSPPGRCGGVKSDRDRDGVPDAADRCPDVPEDLDGDADEDGCPDDQDTDADTVVDSRDLCLLEREDLDGHLDADGCPELDNDFDTIVDGEDKCPNDPEDRDGFEDQDGCADLDNDADGIVDVEDKCPNEAGAVDRGGCPREYKSVELTATAIRITEKVYFETNKAVIRGRSYDLLDTVAVVLKDHPRITIEVQGHTDSVGNDRHNKDLSQRRADAVRAYLVGRGIDPGRLVAKGYGEEEPMDSNRTSQGREANRRVEFVRTDKGASSGATGGAP